MNHTWKKIFFSCLIFIPVLAHTAEPANKFDHYSTGFPLEGAHVTTECESCHVRGIFKGTPTQCAGCHGTSSTIGTSKKHSQHIVFEVVNEQ